MAESALMVGGLLAPHDVSQSNCAILTPYLLIVIFELAQFLLQTRPIRTGLC